MASKQAKRKRGSRFAPDGRVVSVSETLANIVKELASEAGYKFGKCSVMPYLDHRGGQRICSIDLWDGEEADGRKRNLVSWYHRNPHDAAVIYHAEQLLLFIDSEDDDEEYLRSIRLNLFMAIGERPPTDSNPASE